jgi:hypothetical protein
MAKNLDNETRDREFHAAVNALTDRYRERRIAARDWNPPEHADEEREGTRTKFYRLPPELQVPTWGCVCGCINPTTYDTLAISAKGERWTVHYPELHGHRAMHNDERS